MRTGPYDILTSERPHLVLKHSRNHAMGGILNFGVPPTRCGFTSDLIGNGTYRGLRNGRFGGSRVLGQPLGMSSTTGMTRMVFFSYSANPWYWRACSA
jgi:hypothetical protein